jgi:RimJ/RimL family protein N-acetyltransferase
VTRRSDLNWLELQIPTLYVCDARGRLRFIREPGYDESELDPAPRFFMGRSSVGNIWRFRDDLPDDVMLELDALCRAEPVTVDLEPEPIQAAPIRAVLRRHAPITDEYRGPAYSLPEPSSAARGAVIVTEENAQVLEQHFPWKLTSRNRLKTGVLVATLVDGSAVSICFCARLTDMAAEAGADTVESERGRGYAFAAVSVWATAIRALGLEPLYSTSWDNHASRGVARKLGAIRYAENWSIA